MSKQNLLITILFFFLLPLNSFANYTGQQILKRSQKYGMTDRELKYLINNTKPDLTVRDPKFGATSLIHSSINNRPNMVRILLEEGGVDVDETDFNGETALIGAARHCHQPVIDILLEFGADKTLVGKFNKTAYEYAKENCSGAFANKIGSTGKKTSTISGIVKAKGAFKKRNGGMDDEDDWLDEDPGADSSRAKAAFDDLVKVKGILDYMDKYKAEPVEKKKKQFDKMAKAVGVWPALHKKQLDRAKEEEKRKEEMRKKLQGSKKRAMSKLRTMGMLKKGGADYRQRADEAERKRLVDEKIAEKEKIIIGKAEKEKEKDVDNGMSRRRIAIKFIMFSGLKAKNLAALRKEKADVLIKKRDAIKELLDAEESRIERETKLRMAKKKMQTINQFKQGGKQFRARMKKIELEEKKAREKAERDAKLAADRKQRELEELLKREKERMLAETLVKTPIIINITINNQPDKVLELLDEGDADIDDIDSNGETALIAAAKGCHEKIIDILLEYGADKTLVGKFNKLAFEYAKANCSVSLANKIGSSIRVKTLDDDLDDKTLSPRGKKALRQLIEVNNIIVYMDRYKAEPIEKKKKSFDKMAKAIGVWPALHKKQLKRAKEEEERKAEMHKKLNASKKRAMTKLRTMGMLRKGGQEYRKRKEEEERQKLIDAKLAEKEKEILRAAEKEKEKDILNGMNRRRIAIKFIMFSGLKAKNLAALRKEKEELLIKKREAIKKLLDAEESRIEREAKLRIAKKKMQTISQFRQGGMDFRARMNKIALEEKKAREDAERKARLVAERKQKDLEDRLKKEKARLLAELNAKEKSLQDALRREEERRLAEEKRKKELDKEIRGPAMVIGASHADGGVVIDKVNKKVITSDFQVGFLNKRNCQIRRRANGTYFVFILTYKASNIKQAGRNKAIWFINRSEKSKGPSGGVKCPRQGCRDYAIYHAGGVRKDLFMSNLTVELGKNPKNNFEIYSSKVGNSTIKMDITDCKNYPKR